MLASCVGMCVGLGAFGLSFLVQVDNKMPPGLSFLPLGALVTFIIGYNVGMGPIPWVIISEMLPPHVRGGLKVKGQGQGQSKLEVNKATVYLQKWRPVS